MRRHDDATPDALMMLFHYCLLPMIRRCFRRCHTDAYGYEVAAAAALRAAATPCHAALFRLMLLSCCVCRYCAADAAAAFAAAALLRCRALMRHCHFTLYA